MQKEQKKKFRKPTVEKEMEIVRIVEEIVLKRFHKYLKVFEKKELEKIPTKKIQDHVMDLREGFVLKKEKIYPLSKIERKEVQEFVKNQLRKGYI